MSIGSHELALTIINDGKGYSRRKMAGELLRNPAEPRLMVRDMAHEFLAIALEGARAYERKFGSPGASCFTVSDICEAAAELAEYYENQSITKITPAKWLGLPRLGKRNTTSTRNRCL